MTIREFVPGDRAVYLAFSRDFYSGGAVLHPVDEGNFQATFDACVQNSPYTEGYLILEGGSPAGYALVSTTWSNEVGGIAVLLEEIYIAPGFRGRQLGSAFFQWFMDKYFYAKRLRLEVNHENEGAIRLYRRLGFQPLDYGQMVLDR